MGMSEQEALWYHLEDMCEKPPVPKCASCGQTTSLVPPEMLYYLCVECYPDSFDWEPIRRDIEEKRGDVL
jgi:hypothetical protein